MTSKCGTIEYESGAAAVSSVFKLVLERSSLSESELEKPLGITENDGMNFRQYLNGKQVPPWWQFVLKVRFAAKNGWLTKNELCELGLADAANAKCTVNPQHIKNIRKKALRVFVDGRANILNGLLPMRVHDGADGWRNRPPKDDAEMVCEFRKWIGVIRSLGGVVTYETYIRKPTKADFAEAQAETEWLNDLYRKEAAEEAAGERDAREFLRELEVGKHDQLYEKTRKTIRDALTAAIDGSAAEEQAALEAAREEYFAELNTEEAAALPPPPPLPAHHPDKVRNLTLWFGGREYSTLPYRLLEEDDLTGNKYSDPVQGLGGFEVFSIARAARQRRAKEADKSHCKKERRAEAKQVKQAVKGTAKRFASRRSGAKVAHPQATASKF
jgi:hypothetical protein